MSIRFECISCNKGIVVHDRFAGRAVRCPGCTTTLKVPKKTEAEAALVPVSASVSDGIERLSITNASDQPNVKLKSLDDAERQLHAEAPSPSKHSRRIDHGGGEEEEDVEWDITPMVDVAFLLLIFFMLTASFSIQKVIRTKTQSDEKSKSNIVQMDTTENLTVQIDELNSYRVIAPDGDTQEASTKQELMSVFADLKNYSSSEQPPRVIIEAHVDSLHGAVVACMDAAKSAEFTQFQLKSVEAFD